MNRRFFILLGFLLALVVPLRAQQGNSLTLLFAGVPTGTCFPFEYAINKATGALYDCKGGSWNLVGPGAGGPPTGAAGGDLGGTYPNPTVVNGSNITNASIANSGLVNPSTTVNSQTCTLGASCTVPGTAASGTANTVAKYTSATALGNSSVTDDGTNPTREPKGSNSATAGNYQEFTVDTSGTTLALLACATSNVDGSGRPKIQTCGLNNIAGLVGIAQATVAAGGTSLVCWTLNCPAVFDGQTTALDVAIVSTTVAGELHDTGGQISIAGTQNFTILNANSGAGTSSLVDASGLLANNPPSNPGGKTKTIASGTAALGTGAISSATCAAAVTVSGPGIKTTDTLVASFSSDPTAVTGYIPSTNGMLTIMIYPTANNANFKVCNNTSNSVTPGAITLNWIVTR